MTTTHHPTDLRDMRSCVLAVLDDRFGDGTVTAERLDWLDWLDTDEGRNHRHILALWDANEDADYYEELHGRNPEVMDTYLTVAEGSYGERDKARAAYLYGFDLFDDVVAVLRSEVGT